MKHGMPFSSWPAEGNMSPLDRALRFSAGLVLIALAFSGDIGPWGWIGFVPLLTAIVGVCPLYSALGFSTAGRGRKER